MTNTLARTIKRSSVKNIVRFPAIKSQSREGILVESILESKYCYHLEFNRNVKSYLPQPETFSFNVNGKQKKYTPDFLESEQSSHLTYIEVKPAKKSKSEHYQELFSAFDSYISTTNVSFKVVDETEILKEPLLTNYRLLFQYLKSPADDNKKLRDCASLIKTKMPLKNLFQQLEGIASKREVYSWLAQQVLVFDWSSERLTNQTEVLFDV